MSRVVITHISDYVIIHPDREDEYHMKALVRPVAIDWSEGDRIVARPLTQSGGITISVRVLWQG